MNTTHKVGDMVYLDNRRAIRALVLAPASVGRQQVLLDSGTVGNYTDGALMTLEQWLAWAEVFRGDTTPKDFDAIMEKAKRPFVQPPWWNEAVARAMRGVKTDERDAGEVFSRQAERIRVFREKWNEWFAAEPQSHVCEQHDATRTVDYEESQRRSWSSERMQVVINPCPKCLIDSKVRAASSQLKDQGVPDLLLHATFDNFEAVTDEDRLNLAGTREFASIAKGFLVMRGDVGNGKSHLAVAVARSMACQVRFITQNNLLKKLRDTYDKNKNAEDIIEACKKVRLMILDDVGVSPGGRDEFPMLHGILEERHNSRKPTIITTNLLKPQLDETLGERVADRLTQSGFKLLNFTGASRRRQMRAGY